MLEPRRNEVPSKCMLTLGQLPKFNDPKQPPSKSRPFSTVVEQPFLHSIDLVLPAQLYELGHENISKALGCPRYALVKLTLSDILTGPFFTTYIKTGTIALQSAGRAGIDPVYTLYNGVLRLELPRELYERAGLSGSPVRDGGRKHLKERFAVELNLRLPSMVAGRKGFERLKRAAESVLNESTKYLFADLTACADIGDPEAPIAAFKPVLRSVAPSIVKSTVLIPELALSRGRRDDYGDAVFDEEAMDLLEWIDLVVMSSSRVKPGQKVDPFISRYAVPGKVNGNVAEQDVVCLSYKGFLPSEWARDVLALWLNMARKDLLYWLAMSGHTFRTAAVDSKLGWTILRPPEQAAKPDSEHIDHETRTEEDEVMEDNNDEAGARGTKKPKDSTRAVKPFPRFVLYEMTAGENG